MTDFSKPIQTKDGLPAKVIADYGNWLWINCCWLGTERPWTFSISEANENFINVPEPKTIFLREYANRDGIEYSDYRITLIPGQPPQIEEIKP